MPLTTIIKALSSRKAMKTPLKIRKSPNTAIFQSR
jgi:hypothetical protein